ncbi:Dam family site-specific DNA-(adenine-N6)-methyltransferase [Arenimonas donghaensis]|uniref:Dam family site-specific DNA-(adenine-N6)-methyltransferase n=1 Tax=Arenimonas donghaensis TaxID=375061 RepID=UPI000A054A19|nr:Dam family site-specific DNA-(adenine-N6)-methyltransferase [Arenimonas donghaensis]
MKPFLKWAGGKHKLVPRIRELLPDGSRLIEPFAGSGAVFLGTDFEANLIADVNPDIVSLFTQLKYQPDEIIVETTKLFIPEHNSQDAYYQLRNEFNKIEAGVRKAALFVYLNRHCFNGLCRYNASGKFNVPFGRYASPRPPLEEMWGFAEKAQKAEFICSDFRLVLSQARDGDVVYCDPPYVPLTETANFTTYAKGGFGISDQRELADMALALSLRGVSVLISNHDNDETRALYKHAQISAFDVQRFISRDARNRNIAAELIAVYGDGCGATVADESKCSVKSCSSNPAPA